MSTDTEEFESAILLVCSAHNDLKKINPENPALSLVRMDEIGFIPTPEYQQKYIRPHLKDEGGQICLWDGAYPNQFEARMIGLISYHQDLSIAIQTEISGRGLDKLVGLYQR